MIELNEDTHVLGVWFFGSEAAKFDWLAAVTKQPGDTYKGIYRFRYHADNNEPGSEDEKIWFTIDSRAEDRAEGVRLRQAMGRVALALAKQAEADELHYLPFDCSGPEALDQLMQEEWLSARMVGP